MARDTRASRTTHFSRFSLVCCAVSLIFVTGSAVLADDKPVPTPASATQPNAKPTPKNAAVPEQAPKPFTESRKSGEIKSQQEGPDDAAPQTHRIADDADSQRRRGTGVPRGTPTDPRHGDRRRSAR